VPPSIQALLAARIDGLEENERLVLEHASIEGQEFHEAALSALVPDELRPELPALLLALTRKRFVHTNAVHASFASGDVFRFRHLLIRDAAYDALPKAIRADLHSRFGAWLQARGADHVQEFDELLGYHYERAHRYRMELDLVDARTQELGRLAARHLLAAGERAVDRLDEVAAHKLLATAGEVTPEDDPIGVRALAELALECRIAGDDKGARDRAQLAQERAHSAGEEATAAYAELILRQVDMSLGRSTNAAFIERSEQLLGILHRHGDQRGVRRATVALVSGLRFAGQIRRAELLLTGPQAVWRASHADRVAFEADWLGVLLTWGPTPVPEATDRLARILETAPNPATEAFVNASLGWLRAYVGEFDESRRLFLRSEATWRDLGGQSPIRMENYALARSYTELLAGNLPEALYLIQAALDQSIQAARNPFASTAAGLMSHIQLRLGNLGEAERLANLASSLTPADYMDAQTRSLRTRARVLAARRQFDTALELAAAAEALIRPIDILQVRGETWADIAEVYLAAGNMDAAVSYLERARNEFAVKGITVEVARVERRLAEIPDSPTGGSQG
jgi:tetratricopeptide (TPR) repeat protein